MSAGLRFALAGGALLVGGPLLASVSASAQDADACSRHAPEAARRSGLSVDVILRVMHAESLGRPRAMSHKCAMGCMQIMPATRSEEHTSELQSLMRISYAAFCLSKHMPQNESPCMESRNPARLLPQQCIR